MFISKQNTIYLKGIAIFLVILCHVLGKWFNCSEYLRQCMGTSACSLFLILSGYGCYFSYKKNGISSEYWWKKIDKIFIPYWVITLSYLLFLNKKTSAVVIMKNLLCVDFDRNIDGTMWYMSLLFIFYILFYIIFVVRTYEWIKFFFLIMCAFCLKEMAPLFGGCSWQFMQNYLSFPIGVMLAYVTKYTKARTYMYSIGIVSGSIGIYWQWGKSNFQLQGIFVSCVLIMIILSLRLDDIKKRDRFIWKWIGANSYLLYLIEGKLLDIKGFYLFVDNRYLNVGMYFVLLTICAMFIKKIEKLVRRLALLEIQ